LLWVHATPSLVLCVCFVDSCLSFCNFSFGRCFICSPIYGFLLPLKLFSQSYDNRRHFSFLAKQYHPMRQQNLGKISSKFRFSNFVLSMFFQTLYSADSCSHHFKHLTVTVMTCLRVTKYMCHIRRRRICSVYCTTDIPFSLMLNYICFFSRAVIAYPSRAQSIAVCLLISRQYVSLRS
jgi:hypothetical protein